MKSRILTSVARLFTVALFTLLSPFGFSQIHQGSLYLYSQAGVDAAVEITEVTGDLMVTTPSGAADPIVDLDGLGNLESVGGLFMLANNPGLVDTSGLSGLTDVGQIVVMWNPSLGDLDGLSNLAIADKLFIRDNGSSFRFCGLDLLFQVQGTTWNYTINYDRNWYYPGWGNVLQLIGGPCEQEAIDPELYVEALLEEGLLNEGESKALTKQIRQATPKALLNHLAALVRSGRLSEAETQPIIDSVLASQ